MQCAGQKNSLYGAACTGYAFLQDGLVPAVHTALHLSDHTGAFLQRLLFSALPPACLHASYVTDYG